jgi:hypothetical protein
MKDLPVDQRPERNILNVASGFCPYFTICPIDFELTLGHRRAYAAAQHGRVEGRPYQPD